MRQQRPLTPAERTLVAGLFGNAIDSDAVRIRHWRWWPFQPTRITMAPMGHIHIPPKSPVWRDCFADSDIGMQAFFLHEMTHVWQAQTKGRWYLPLMRHPFCRYPYDFTSGKPFERYGIEQQAEIVRHVHLLRHGVAVEGAPPLPELEAILPFG